jgi:site-specific recombinase XerD
MSNAALQVVESAATEWKVGVYGASDATSDPVVVYLSTLAPASRRAVASDLRIVAGILTGALDARGRPRADYEGLPWRLLERTHVAFVRGELARLYAPSSANRILSSLRGVLRSAWELGQIEGEVYHRAASVKSVRGKSLPAGRALSPEEIRALLEVCAADPSVAGRRDAAMIAVLYGAGLRRAELVALTLSDYEPKSGRITVRAGKGNKGRYAYLQPDGADLLAAWLDERGTRPGALFLPVHRSGRTTYLRKDRKTGQRIASVLTEQAVYHMLERRAGDADVDAFSPHDLRRTFAGDLLDAGADISLVQQLMGHASVVTTQAYDRRGEEAKRRAAGLLSLPRPPMDVR